MTGSTGRAVAAGRRGKMDRNFLLATQGDATRRPTDPQAVNVITLPTATRGVVKVVTDEASGKAVLHILVRNSDQELMPPFVQDWHRYGEIGIAFAEAIAARRLAYSSMPRVISDVELFLAWLRSQSDGRLPTDLCFADTKRLLAYRSHLDAGKRADGKPHSPQTKRVRLGSIRSVFSYLQRRSGRWKSRLDPTLRFPEGAWPATARQSKPRPTLSEDTLRAILMACASEMEATMARHEDGRSLLEKGCKHLRPDMGRRADFKELSVALAAVATWFGGSSPSLKAIREKHKALGDAITAYHSLDLVADFLYPDCRSLVPFVLLLTVHTIYNPDTILGLRLSQILTNEVFTDEFRLDRPERVNSRAQEDEPSQVPERLRTRGAKGRAKRGRPQHRSFRIDPDDAFGAHMTIEHIKVLTSRLRLMAPSRLRDRLFLFRLSDGSGSVRSFGGDAKRGIAGDALWQHVLKLFIADHKLPAFTLSSIRVTMAEAAERLTGDLRAVQLLLGHAGCDVTFNHYFTAAGRKRASESVATAQSMRHRWAETEGKCDVREQSQGDSLMSATPGMDCMDPYDSPMPGQVKGKMCSAWLACFFCPLAAVQRDHAYSFARLVQLEDHVTAAAATIAPERYQAAYMPVLKKIREWLERFTPAAREAAAAITYLKPLPELE